jgi:hypothetical protein
VLDAHIRGSGVEQLVLTFDEAAFFFSPSTCEWLRTLKVDCQAFAEVTNESPSKVAALKNTLMGHLRAMPKRFHDDLSLGQLTSD